MPTAGALTPATLMTLTGLLANPVTVKADRDGFDAVAVLIVEPIVGAATQAQAS